MSQARPSPPSDEAPTPDASADAAPAATGAPASLDALRERLDGVDDALHRLIAERFAIVEAIAAAKGPGGVVIRPDREAAVLSQRLSGAQAVPPYVLATFWRQLVSGACMTQRPYRVHVTPETAEAGRILHSAAPAVLHTRADSALTALDAAPGDIALINERDIPLAHAGSAHALVAADAGDGTIVAFGGTGVEPANGPAALIATDTGAAVTDTPATGDTVLARVHRFPLPLSISVPQP